MIAEFYLVDRGLRHRLPGLLDHIPISPHLACAFPPHLIPLPPCTSTLHVLVRGVDTIPYKPWHSTSSSHSHSFSPRTHGFRSTTIPAVINNNNNKCLYASRLAGALGSCLSWQRNSILARPPQRSFLSSAPADRALGGQRLGVREELKAGVAGW